MNFTNLSFCKSAFEPICDAVLTAAELVWLVAAVVVLIADVLQRDALAVAAFELVVRAGSMSRTLAFADGGIRNSGGERWTEVTAGQLKTSQGWTLTRTVLLPLIGAVAAVVHGVAQLVAVYAAVVVTAESERRLTLDVHCKFTKIVKKNLQDNDFIGVCVCGGGADFLQQRWSSSSELSPQSLSPSHFQWGCTHTWFLHSNRKGGQ